ncbi:MAG: hypothetical protein ACTHLK_22810, partial [Brucella intermedia]
MTTVSREDAKAETLWAVNIHGPDDLIAAPDYMSAIRMANAFNAWWLDLKTKQPHNDAIDARMWAVPTDWEGDDAKGHAEELSKPHPEYQWLREASALPHLTGVGVNSAKIEAARKAVEELANVQMNLSLSEWSRLSSVILSALEPSAADMGNPITDKTVKDKFKGTVDGDTELQAAARHAGWALIELVDEIDWLKREQVSDIITRLGIALNEPSDGAGKTEVGNPATELSTASKMEVVAETGIRATEPSAARELAFEKGYRRGIEAAAKIIEGSVEGVVMSGSQRGKRVLASRVDGDLSGLGYAAAIRALSSPDHNADAELCNAVHDANRLVLPKKHETGEIEALLRSLADEISGHKPSPAATNEYA